MKKGLGYLILTLACTICAGGAFGQIVSGNLFLQGKYLEVGMQRSGAMGTSVNAPSGYHPHGGTPPCGGSSPLASVYDWGKDGWSAGTPAYMGDYTLPGSPWEEWAVQAAGTMYPFNSSSCTAAGGFSGYAVTPGTLGAWWSTVGSRATANWTGSVGSGTGTLDIHTQHRVDTLGAAVIFTVVLNNNNAVPINDVYYMRSCDPDNDQSWSGGSFTTDNYIVYQNDYYHRVLVTALATGGITATGIPAAPYSLGTKDCRAKALIFTSWPLSCTDLSGIWAGTAGCAGTIYMGLNSNTAVSGDIAIGLIYNLGNIPAHDSVMFSYAYIYSGTLGIDSAFPSPRLVVNGVGYDSDATIYSCSGSLTDTLPIQILYGTDKCWSRSTWTWVPAGDTALVHDTGVVNGIIIPNLMGATRTYTITGTQAMGSCAQKTFILTIIPSTFGPPGVADVYYCQDDFASPLTATGINLLWYSSATGGTGSTSAPTPSTYSPGVYYFWVSQSPCAGSESSRAMITVYVTPRPVITATNSSPICAGNALYLYGHDTFTVGTITYNWSGPGGFSSTSHNPVITSATSVDSGYFMVTLTVNGCTSLPDTTFAIVHDAPPPPAVTNVTYCQYASGVVALIATGTSLRWYISATGGSGSSTAPTPSVAVAGTFTFYVTQTTNGCESSRAPLIVTVNPKPAPPTVTLQTYCQYDLPSPVAASGTALLWYGPGVSGSATAPTPSTVVAGIDSYYVTQTILGCVSDRAFDPVTIIAKPAPPTTTNVEYCQFSNAAMLGAGGANLQWYLSSAGGTALAGAPTPSTTTVGTTTWYVSQIINGCESDRSAISCTIIYLPVFTITQSRKFVCEFDTLTLAYNGPGLTAPGYTWVMPTGASYITGTSSDPVVVVRLDSLYFQNVTLTASDDSGKCFTTDTLHIKVIPEPTATAYIKGNICLGDTIDIALTSRSANADHYLWDFDNGHIITANSNSGGPYSVRWLDSGVHIISVISYSEEGCPGKLTFDTVKVHALPDARIHTPNFNGVLCMEDSIMLAAETDDYSRNYAWAPEHFFHNNHSHKIWGKIELPGYVTLTVTDAFGCSASDSVLLTPDACCTVKFPTGFTPNGDGKNDYFRPVFKGFHRFHSFRVVNRWGQTVFESANNRMEWDGTFGGVPQDMGVYYYYIKYDCEDGKGSKERIEKGEVTLIR